MLTRLVVRNFKRFDDIEVELGNPVVLIGPNNSGKTTALQALALWDIGLRRWNEKRKRTGKEAGEKRPGVTINRRDLIAMPMPAANLLWRNLHVRDVEQAGGSPRTANVRIDIVVEGITQDQNWECGLEFDYANTESIYCRPLRTSDSKDAPRMPVPQLAANQRVAFLPPMSGLAATEPKWDEGRINVLIGEGQTAQILRNLCHTICEDNPEGWNEVCEHIASLFAGISLDPPKYIPERGEITMTYREGNVQLDLSASGRGLQQTLLLLTYIYAHPASVLLLDEPDAHLEILRQRQTYQLITETAEKHRSQIIAASHSEVVLNEAADKDLVIAFLGNKPHRIDGRVSQLRKALMEIGSDQYYQAEEAGWVLYLEGATDLAILRSFAHRTNHPAYRHLQQPFVYYVANQPQKARDHFFGLREAKPDLTGIAIFDRLSTVLQDDPRLRELMWQRREIENYLCYPEVLEAYARSSAPRDESGPLFEVSRINVMRDCIVDRTAPAALHDPNDRFWTDTKASDEYLDPIFAAFFERLRLPNLMQKSGYHGLAALVPAELIQDEIGEKLDAILQVAESAPGASREGCPPGFPAVP